MKENDLQWKTLLRKARLYMYRELTDLVGELGGSKDSLRKALQTLDDKYLKLDEEKYGNPEAYSFLDNLFSEGD